MASTGEADNWTSNGRRMAASHAARPQHPEDGLTGTGSGSEDEESPGAMGDSGPSTGLPADGQYAAFSGDSDPTQLQPGARPPGRQWIRWTAEEHAMLEACVKKLGARSWSVIASHIPGRTGKQCRERWLNHTSLDSKRGNWAHQEEYILAEQHSVHGSQWCRISRHLPGRNDNAVKNHWNATWRSKVMHKPQSILWLYCTELKRNKSSSDALRDALLVWEHEVPSHQVLETLGFWPSERYTGVLASPPAALGEAAPRAGDIKPPQGSVKPAPAAHLAGSLRPRQRSSDDHSALSHAVVIDAPYAPTGGPAPAPARMSSVVGATAMKGAVHRSPRQSEASGGVDNMAAHTLLQQPLQGTVGPAGVFMPGGPLMAYQAPGATLMSGGQELMQQAPQQVMVDSAGNVIGLAPPTMYQMPSQPMMLAEGVQAMGSAPEAQQVYMVQEMPDGAVMLVPVPAAPAPGVSGMTVLQTGMPRGEHNMAMLTSGTAPSMPPRVSTGYAPVEATQAYAPAPTQMMYCGPMDGSVMAVHVMPDGSLAWPTSVLGTQYGGNMVMMHAGAMPDGSAQGAGCQQVLLSTMPASAPVAGSLPAPGPGGRCEGPV